MVKFKTTRQGYISGSINSMKTSGIPFLKSIEYEDNIEC